jgi:hypothetical protein
MQNAILYGNKLEVLYDEQAWQGAFSGFQGSGICDFGFSE